MAWFIFNNLSLALAIPWPNCLSPSKFSSLSVGIVYHWVFPTLESFLHQSNICVVS